MLTRVACVQLLAASVLQSDLISIPSAPAVKLLGNGVVENHEGIARAELKHPQHLTFHAAPLPADESKLTRFYRWHMDAALYKFEPPVVTTLLALTVPEGRRQTIDYGDGSGDTIENVSLGTTAFVSGQLAFEALSDEMKSLALRTQARNKRLPSSSISSRVFARLCTRRTRTFGSSTARRSRRG